MELQRISHRQGERERTFSFYANLQINCSLVYRFLHGCGLHYIVLSGLYISKTGSKRVNDELHKCALPRMKIVLEFIDATDIASS